MAPSKSLTPREAEQVILDRIERFGSGALPEVYVAERADGTWQVHWDAYERIVRPMNEEEWCAWLQEHVGPLDAQSLQTTES